MRSLRILPLSLSLLAIALVLGAAAAQMPASTPQKLPGYADHAEMRIRATLPDTFEITSTQTWSGGNARDMRQSLDAYFGLANGMLTEEEVLKIIDAAEKDLHNKSLPFLSVNGAGPLILNVEVSLPEVAGPVDSMGDVVLAHTILASAPILPDAPSRLVVNAPWNGTLTVEPPAGFLVVSRNGNEATAERPLARGRDVEIMFAPAPAEREGNDPPPAPGENETPPDIPAEVAQKVPGLSAPHVAALVALAALWIWWWRDDARRR